MKRWRVSKNGQSFSEDASPSCPVVLLPIACYTDAIAVAELLWDNRRHLNFVLAMISRMECESSYSHLPASVIIR